MNIKTTIFLAVVLLFLAAGFAQAQTASFTFGPINPPPYPYPPQQCAAATFDNGQGGSICLAIYPYGYTNIDIPQAYGFPNNGYLTEGRTVPSPIGFGSPGFTINADGVTASQSFTADTFYDGGNTTVSAVVQFKRVSHVNCGRTGCHTFYSWVVSGGSGTAVN